MTVEPVHVNSYMTFHRELKKRRTRQRDVCVAAYLHLRTYRCLLIIYFVLAFISGFPSEKILKTALGKLELLTVSGPPVQSTAEANSP